MGFLDRFGPKKNRTPSSQGTSEFLETKIPLHDEKWQSLRVMGDNPRIAIQRGSEPDKKTDTYSLYLEGISKERIPKVIDGIFSGQDKNAAKENIGGRVHLYNIPVAPLSILQEQFSDWNHLNMHKKGYPVPVGDVWDVIEQDRAKRRRAAPREESGTQIV